MSDRTAESDVKQEARAAQGEPSSSAGQPGDRRRDSDLFYLLYPPYDRRDTLSEPDFIEPKDLPPE